MLTIGLFFIGLIVLVKSADMLVDGASAIAKKFNISNLVIGLTIVAFGTSAPELFVNVIASINDNVDIAIGNVIGSNIANILLILGLAGLIMPLQVTKSTVWKEIPLSLLAAVLVLAMANDTMVDKMGFNQLTRSDGLVLLSFFIIFIYYSFGIAKNQPAGGKEASGNELKTPAAGLFMALGLAGLVLGGKWIVDGAVSMASMFGMSEALIGLTIVAVGTSLPEMATSLVAAFKKNADIAVGNIVGSNIFNIFFILGVSATVRPLPMNVDLNLDLIFSVAASLLLFIWMFVGYRHRLDRWQSVIFLLLYLVYTAAIINRG